MKSGIYQIENLVNGKVYIGSSQNLNARRRGHYYNLRHNQHKNQHLQNSFNKYGESCFIHTVLHYCDVDMLIFFEQYYIDDYSVNRLYNKCLIVGSRVGVKCSEETRKKMSLACIGRKASEETRQKMSLAQIGRKYSDETKQKISSSLMGNTNARKH